MYQVIIRDLKPGPGCLPSLISKKRGHPKTTRIRKRATGKGKQGVLICGVDKKVTINGAVGQQLSDS
jgi:hypothetical protein